MAEILLPTAAKQDLIKQDTAEILNQFPISGGTDWQSRRAIVANRDFESLYRGSTTTFLQVTGKGIIHSIFFRAIDHSVFLDVYIDGELFITKSGIYQSSSITIMPLVAFNSSLQIVLRNTNPTADRPVEVVASYSL